MEEIGADTSVIRDFVNSVKEKGIDEALSIPKIPQASKNFVSTTFQFIKEGKPHNIAAAFSLGREDIIPRHVQGAA